MSLFDLHTAVATMTALSNGIASTYVSIRSLNTSALTTTRQSLQTNISDTDVDALTKLIQGMRTVESSIQSKSIGLLSPLATFLDNYYRSQTGMKMRVFFKPGVNTFVSTPPNITWDDGFRDFWRKSLSEELVVRLGSFSNTTGSFGLYVADKSVELNSTLEIHTPNLIGSNNITGTIVFLNASGTTSSVSISIPSATPAGSVLPISRGGKFVSVSSAVFTGGSIGDVIEIWVA